MSYRKLKHSDTWHFCRNCSQWPTVPGTYDERYTKPTSGELDNQCLGKDKAGNCNK
ncbi:MAG: hypothetical protein PVG83_04520 [Acidimicrobiia bacterium]|jgi:hypothetical protein